MKTMMKVIVAMLMVLSSAMPVHADDGWLGRSISNALVVEAYNNLRAGVGLPPIQDSRVIPALIGRTDANGNLYVIADAGSGTTQDTRAIGSLVGRTDSSGNLYVTLAGGTALFGDGSSSSPSIAFANEPGMGFYRPASTHMYFPNGKLFGIGNYGVGSLVMGQGILGVRFASASGLWWASGTNEQGAADTNLMRTGVGQLAVGGAFSGGTPAAQAVINGTLTTSTTSTCTAANTTETDLWTYSLPAGALSADGRGVRITAFGTNAANANVKVVRGYFGGTSFVAQNAAANGVNWRVTYEILRSSATAQVLSGIAFSSTGVGGPTAYATPAETMANAITIKVTGQNGTAAANDICVKGAIVETIK